MKNWPKAIAYPARNIVMYPAGYAIAFHAAEDRTGRDVGLYPFSARIQKNSISHPLTLEQDLEDRRRKPNTKYESSEEDRCETLILLADATSYGDTYWVYEIHARFRWTFQGRPVPTPGDAPRLHAERRDR